MNKRNLLLGFIALIGVATNVLLKAKEEDVSRDNHKITKEIVKPVTTSEETTKRSNAKDKEIKEELEKKHYSKKELKQIDEVVDNLKEHEEKHFGKGHYEEVDLENLLEILPILDTKNTPRVVYNMDDLALENLQVKEKKEKFFEIMVPTAMVVKEEIEIERLKVKDIIDGKKEIDNSTRELFKSYRVKNEDLQELYKKMKPVPVSILLSQAILESGWGTSRFFKKANNIFGVWSMNPDEPRIPASQSREDRQVYLKKYSNLKDSMKDYMELIGKHNAYKGFRNTLEGTEDYEELIPYLEKYSEIGKEYTKRLEATIKYNKLYEFDKYELE